MPTEAQRRMIRTGPRPGPVRPRSVGAARLHRAVLTGCAVLGALLAPATSAMAQSGPYFLGGSLSLSQDSNLLRLPNGQAAPTGYDKSDLVTSTSLLAGIDQSFGRQRVWGNLALRSNRFARNRIYDNQSYTATTGLEWSTVQRLSGSLSASASRNLSSFNLEEIGLLDEKNQESAQAVDAAVRWGLVTAYALEITAGRRQIKNSLDLQSVQTRNYEQDHASIGMRWQPMAASRLGLALRTTQGRYPRFRLVAGTYDADRFKRNDVDLTAGLQLSGSSSVDLRLSSGRTHYDLATQRDFSGLTGALTWAWLPGGKTRLSARLSRDTGQDSYAVVTFFGTPGTADYSRVNTALRVKIDHDATAKVALSLALTYADRELVRTLPAFAGSTEASGRDRHTSAALGVRWTPRRSLLLGCDLSQEARRAAGGLSSDLDGRQASCFVQFTLQ